MASELEPHIKMLDDGDRHYLVRVTAGGTTRVHRFGSRTAAIMAVAKNRKVLTDPTWEPPILNAFLSEWQCDHVERELAIVTQKDYRCCAGRLVIPHFDGARIDLISGSMIDLYVSKLLAEDGFKSADRGRRTLSAMLGVAASWGYIPFNPVGRFRQ